MNIYILDLLVIGLLLLAVSLGSRWISRLPLSFSLIYLICGFFLGRYGLKLFNMRPEAEILERLTEFVVIVSVYSCGLKMNRPLKFWAWKNTARLIGFLMPISIFAIALVCHFIINMDWGSSILLGAILAPTDPVLASEVQMSHFEDKDELRFALTSEGGLNDALAFPFVYFGIYWLTKGEFNQWFVQWVAVDLIWAIAAGITMGIITAKLVVFLERKWPRPHTEEDIRENFLGLSTILLTYALTELVNGYGFLAVFVAGVVVQKSYSSRRESEKHYNQLEFSEQLEKLLEIAMILLLGSLVLVQPMYNYFGQALWVSGLLFFIIRPVGTLLSTFGSSLPMSNRLLVGWFGIRGVGSLYYLSYALGHQLEKNTIEQIAWITIITMILSIILHGITSTPLMNLYENNLTKSKKFE
ncbi:sodium/hydrogen exchanger [Gloeothece citriformis PCC 7424]|uniref:Sodium/hydrogen exchanger n=1 Tax=Gloeothece citriformis (strain PCC 7424) TaxID=65393 RepID=B7KKL2_GLOC7|nr:sodium:proton antiporter [Gloeothece citriformis]ACK72345.1 sodium/hydrogen exchanger [Gloeothece citriformis PCC 7424]